MSKAALIESISILIPTFQGMPFLPRVLKRLAEQSIQLPWNCLVVDSGSTDGSFEFIVEAARDFPVELRVERIHPSEFDHGDTRNRLAAESTGDLLVYLTQDAIPSGPDWLAQLVANFEDEQVGAAYCRNIPRPDASNAAKVLCADDPGYASERCEVRLPAAADYAAMDAHERRLLYNFNDVASALRRDLWQRHPFPRTSFGEDLLMARAILEAGYTVVYDSLATVEHSHDYDAQESLERARIDGRFNAEWLDRTCVATQADARALGRRFAAMDEKRAAEIHSGEPAAALAKELSGLREATFQGLYEGGCSQRRRPATRMSDGQALKVLYVVHSFPPETWAGTEVYTLGLAEGIAALGHDVTILTRSAEGAEELELREGELRGLRVLRLYRSIEGQSMADSYRHAGVERVFRDLLRLEKPDVVHFQHSLHLSTGLVGIAADEGCATLYTCNDYWGVCPRVQLIRPDGERCMEHRGLGCLMCLKDKSADDIEGEHLALGTATPFLNAASTLLGRPARGANTRSGFNKLRRQLGDLRDSTNRQAYVIGEMARADFLIAPSRFLRERMLASGGFEPERFIYSDYGTLSDHIQGQHDKLPGDGRLRVAFIGSLLWYKGVDVLIEAVTRIDPSRVVLDIHGAYEPDSDPYQARLGELAENAPVHFHGRFDNARLAELYRGIDVLVVPSTWFENSPITIHEAQLLKTPLVVSDIGGMAELVDDGVDGLHFKVGEPDSLAAALQRLIDEGGLLEDLSGRAPAIKSMEQNAREFEYRYRALCCLQR